MSRNLLLKNFLILFGALILSLGAAPGSRFLINHFFPKGSNDWIGFAGNIVGGILGGICTLLGVAYAFSLENKKAYKETIPHKIVGIYSLKQEIINHLFSNTYGHSKTKQEALESLGSFLKEIRKFSGKKEEFLEKSSHVDTEIFAAVEHYYDSVDIIEMNITAFMEKNSLAVTEINKEISDANDYHLELIEIMKGIFEEKEAYYINYLHNQKKPKEILDKFNNHQYLNDIARNNRN